MAKTLFVFDEDSHKIFQEALNRLKVLEGRFQPDGSMSIDSSEEIYVAYVPCGRYIPACEGLTPGA